MSHNRPFFSIVIPTRNRAYLLRYALQSALDQTFEDYEIIVSDNCSADDTAQVVKGLSTPKVRYVRVDKPLSMPDHWEFALGKARGQYITYLCDDDALHPDVLKRVDSTIAKYGSSLIVLGSAIYYGDNWLDPTRRNCVATLSYTGRTRECDSRDTLTDLFKCLDTYDAPRMQNSFCHRDIISQLQAQYERIFLLIPDYSFAAFSLASVPKWTYIDEPLRLQGVFAQGIGATTLCNRGTPIQGFVQEFGRISLLERVPLKIPVTANFIAEALLMVKERVGAKLADFEINWEYYFFGCWERILIQENFGVGVEADKEEFFRVLAGQPEEVQSRVRAFIKGATTSHPLKRVARTIINSSPLLTRLESIVRSPKNIVVYGKEAGFSDILECARHLHTLLSRKVSSS